jgi:hypothetical protein
MSLLHKIIFIFKKFLAHRVQHAEVNNFQDKLALVNDKKQPNINEFWWIVKDIEAVKLNSKNFGYEIAKKLASDLTQNTILSDPSVYGLVSKPTTQKDVESPWFSYWCNELKIAPIYHRKLWEFAFFLQALYEGGLFNKKGAYGIGFGCGQEPIASYLASRNIAVTVTDLEPEKVAGMGWINTAQHTSTLDLAFYPDLVSRDKFEQFVTHKFADMNNIPDDLGGGADFCWSICAFEHLGSIEKGLAFVENSLKVLKPGGIAVHTTEFNYLSDDLTIDDWPTVLFLRKHFEELAVRLSSKGHRMLGPDFDIGSGVLDRFIDTPPYVVGDGGWFKFSAEQWGNSNQAGHLKLTVDGFPCTCFAVVVIKSS